MAACHPALHYCLTLLRVLCVAAAHGADQWNHQATIHRLNESLIARGYVTWFDLTNMKGSTMDAISDAIEGADVMLYGVSRAYKESANVGCTATHVPLAEWNISILPQLSNSQHSHGRCTSVVWRPTTPTSRSWT